MILDQMLQETESPPENVRKPYYDKLVDMLCVNDEDVTKLVGYNNITICDSMADYHNKVVDTLHVMQNSYNVVSKSGVEFARIKAEFLQAQNPEQQGAVISKIADHQDTVKRTNAILVGRANFLNHLSSQLELGNIIDVGQGVGEMLDIHNTSHQHLVGREVSNMAVDLFEHAQEIGLQHNMETIIGDTAQNISDDLDVH